MYSGTIYFLISFALIITLISLKSFELKNNKKTWLSRIGDKTDNKIHFAYNKLKKFISFFNKKSAIALIEWIAYHILSKIRAMYIWVRAKAHAHPPSKKVIDMVRGKENISSGAGASFYLKKIGEE
ncbi:MAG TPA: hypothetical protein VJC02_01420 [Candidatus Paceibacterota bacterium]